LGSRSILFATGNEVQNDFGIFAQTVNPKSIAQLAGGVESLQPTAHCLHQGFLGSVGRVAFALQIKAIYSGDEAMAVGRYMSRQLYRVIQPF